MTKLAQKIIKGQYNIKSKFGEKYAQYNTQKNHKKLTLPQKSIAKIKSYQNNRLNQYMTGKKEQKEKTEDIDIKEIEKL